MRTHHVEYFIARAHTNQSNAYIKKNKFNTALFQIEKYLSNLSQTGAYEAEQMGRNEMIFLWAVQTRR